MDLILEFIIDLILEDSISDSKKKSKSFRYIIFGLILLIYVAIISLITITGIDKLKDNVFEGILILAFGICLLLMCIIRFKIVYQKKIQIKKN